MEAKLRFIAHLKNSAFTGEIYYVFRIILKEMLASTNSALIESSLSCLRFRYSTSPTLNIIIYVYKYITKTDIV